MMQSLSKHSQQLIKQRGRTDSCDSSLDPDDFVINEARSSTTVIEDDKFRVSVPPVAKSLASLLKDLEESFYSIKGVGDIRPSMVFPDVTKLGLRYTFFEGMGFIEYGEFQQPVEEPKSQRSSFFTEVRSDRSLTNLIVEQDCSASVLCGLGIQCELKTSQRRENGSFRLVDEAKNRLSASLVVSSDDNIDTRDNSKRQSQSDEKQMRASTVNVQSKVAKITIGYFSETGDGSLDPTRPMAIFDEEEGFTVIGRVSNNTLTAKVKSALVDR